MERIIYKLTAPEVIEPFKIPLNREANFVIVKPYKLAICHADYRYYKGLRNEAILKKKLPMALIHEGIGIVESSYSPVFQKGDKVVMLPNILNQEIKTPVFDNYNPKSIFLSSTGDGFMQEYISLPSDNLILLPEEVDFNIATFLEPLSVCCHALERCSSHLQNSKEIAIWGDGNLGFLLAITAHHLFPNIKISIIGKHEEKLRSFLSLVAHSFNISLEEKLEVPGFSVGFEVVGSQNSSDAINQIIRFINPMGAIVLMGVSECKVAINTRDILEKGLTLYGCSRSHKKNFETALKVIKEARNQELMKHLIYQITNIHQIEDIHKAFEFFGEKKGRVIMNWNL
jgi:ribitol-5-phosphate 2-dehydrogenase